MRAAVAAVAIATAATATGSLLATNVAPGEDLYVLRPERLRNGFLTTAGITE